MNKLKHHLWLILILITGFALRMAAIVVDPFLHPWDERFHALVGRNMMDNPIVPILRVNPISDNYDKFMWCCNHIWVHKQPLFMWQMALSMKVFGISEWSMRLPSALMGTLLILIIYRVAILFGLRKRAALLVSLMLAFSNFHLQMISGIHGMDHNDVAHGFYVMASIWALFEYRRSPKWYWAVLIGVFSGAAILNKWLTGLLVYLIWGLALMIALLKKQPIRVHIWPFIYSLLACCIVFLPWQFYIMYRFPDLAAYEYEFNRRHISEALEGHAGGNRFYIDRLSGLLGKYIYYLIPLGVALSLRSKSIRQDINWGLIIGMTFVFCFFSYIVKTKVDTYLFFIVPLALLYIALAVDSLLALAARRIMPLYIMPVLVLALAYWTLNPEWISSYLSPDNKERNERIYNANIYRNLKQELPEGYKVVMNMNSFEDVDVMFYNPGITAYHWTLPEEDFKSFEERKIPIAVFEPHGDYNLPEYVLRYPYLHIINKQLKNF